MKKLQIGQFKIRYLILPDFVFNNESLSFLSAKIYAFIHNYKAEEFYFSNERLAEIFGCSERSITRSIDQLKAEKYIDTNTDGKKRYIQDLYSMIDRSVYHHGSTKLSTPSEADGSTEVSSLNEANLKLPNKNNINKNNKNSSINEEKNMRIPSEVRQARKAKKQPFTPHYQQGGKTVYPKKGGSFNAKNIY